MHIHRLRAGLLHFSISLSVFLLIFLLLIYFWYPEPYFSNSGGWEGIRIVACVDVVIGPLLTIIVFNSTKKNRELVTDISVIAVMQCLALFWGVYVLYMERPVATVFWDGSFYTVPAKAFIEKDHSLLELSQFSQAMPAIIYAEKPNNLTALKKMLDVMTTEKIPPPAQFQLYRSLKENILKMKPEQFDIDQILAKNPNVKKQLTLVLDKHNVSNMYDVLYFLLKSKYSNSVLIFDQKANYLGFIDPS